MGLFGGKNSFLNKPLGKNSDASKVATAILKPARGVIDSVEALSKGDLEKSKNYLLGAVGSASPVSMAVNSSSTVRKTLKSTGFTDQLVQMTDYSNKLSTGKNLTWKEQLGYIGGALETTAYAVGGYYAGSAAGLWGGSGAGSTAAASSSTAFGSKATYLGSNFGAASTAEVGTTGLLGANTGTTVAAATPNYLGASTSFTSSTASTGFFSNLATKTADYAKGYWGRVGQGAIDTVVTSSVLGLLGGKKKEQAAENSVYGYTDPESGSNNIGGTTSLFPLDQNGGPNWILIGATTIAAALAFILFRKFKK